MPKRLILIRHAKSSWDAPLDDHSRRLNDRGRRNAVAIGGWLAAKVYVPDHIYTSDAARTLETTDRLATGLGTAPEVTAISQMYHGSPAALMKVLQGAQGDTIALIAHNPGIAFFAEQIVAQEPDHPRFADYPTCATLVCDFPLDDWTAAAPASAKVVDFVVPRDLTDPA